MFGGGYILITGLESHRNVKHNAAYIVPQNNLDSGAPSENKEMFYEKVMFELRTEGYVATTQEK